MRSANELVRLESAKKKSRRFDQQIVLETRLQREYFRFREGSLAEYDLTKASGKQIKLTEEEREGLDYFNR